MYLYFLLDESRGAIWRSLGKDGGAVDLLKEFCISESIDPHSSLIICNGKENQKLHKRLK